MELTKVLQDLDSLKLAKPGNWVLKHNDKILTLVSGKSVWNLKGHAKSALASHFSKIYDYNELVDLGFNGGTQLAQYMVEQNIIKVEQL